MIAKKKLVTLTPYCSTVEANIYVRNIQSTEKEKPVALIHYE